MVNVTLFTPPSRYFSASGYRKFPKYSDTQKNCCNHSKIWTIWRYHRVMSPNDADGIANSVDHDQTAPLEQSDMFSIRLPVWSGSALFSQTYLSENLGTLRYSSWPRMSTWSQRTSSIICIMMMYRNDPKFSFRYAWANSADPDQSSLIRVYTVCHSVCIVWTHYTIVEPHSSNFRVISTNFLSVRIFRKFTVLSGTTTRRLTPCICGEEVEILLKQRNHTNYEYTRLGFIESVHEQ